MTPPLSRRELDVVEAAERGETAAVTALNMHISEDTVETYRRRVLAKLDAHSMAEAAAKLRGGHLASRISVT